MSLIVEENMLTVRGDKIDMFKAIEMKKILEALLGEGCRRITVSLIGIKEMSGTAFQVLSTIGRKFDDFRIISSDRELKERLAKSISHCF